MAGEIYNRAAALGYTNSFKEADLDDLIIWSDDTCCYRYELEEMGHMSDDYIVVPYGAAHYITLTGELE